MPVTYLGFLETLQKLLGDVFNDVLAPILSQVAQVIFNLALTLIHDVLSKILMQFLTILLKIVDFLSSIFDIFSGVRYIHYYDGASHALQVAEHQVINGVTTLVPKGTIVQYQQVYLLDLFVQYGPIQRAFLLITFFAGVLALIFTMYSVTKSISDMTLDGKNPVGKVMGRALKAAGTFLLVPFFVLFMLQLSTIVVVQVSDFLSQSGTSGAQPSIGTIIFLSGSLNAGKTVIQNPSFTDALRVGYYDGSKSYANMSQIESDFDLTKFDTLICYVCAILVIIIMIASIFLFVRRIFEVLVLYLTAPLFVAAMPLDDGNLFSKWRELFVAKIFSGFGTVFAMKLFLVLVPLLSGPSITLYSGNHTVDAILKLFIVIGGAWTVFRSQTLILQILNPEAAYAAQSSIMSMFGLVGMAAGSVGGLVRSAVGGGGKNGGAAQKNGNNTAGSPAPTQQQLFGSQSSGGGQRQSQAFTGK